MDVFGILAAEIEANFPDFRVAHDSELAPSRYFIQFNGEPLKWLTVAIIAVQGSSIVFSWYGGRSWEDFGRQLFVRKGDRSLVQNYDLASPSSLGELNAQLRELLAACEAYRDEGREPPSSPGRSVGYLIEKFDV